MPSTQPSLSTQKHEVDVVNKQPPPAPVMSTDPNAPGQRAMRLRGGCVVRLTPLPFQFFSNYLYVLLGMLDTLWMLRIIVLLLRRRAHDATCGIEAQRCVFFCSVLLFIPQFHLLLYTYSRTLPIPLLPRL